MNQRRLFRFFAVLVLPIAIAACGGGGGGDTPTATSSTSIGNPSLNGGKGYGGSTDGRARALAAASASATPASGVPGSLPLTPGGKIVLNEIQHFVGFNKTPEGKYFGLSDASGTHLVDPARVVLFCFNSFETGWYVNGRISRACGAVDPVTGYVPLPVNATCNRAQGTWSAVLDDNTILWVDHESARAWEIEGLPVTRHTAATDPLRGLVDYGAGGRQQPFATAAVNGGKVDLTINFGSNCLGGFGLDDELTNLMPADNTYYKFLYNSDLEGWGIVQVADRSPSKREAYAEYDPVAGSYTLTFLGLKCGDRGQVTVYKGTGPSTAVVWDPGKSEAGEVGYGVGWFAIQQNPNELQLWVAKAPLTFDRDKYQFVLPGC